LLQHCVTKTIATIGSITKCMLVLISTSIAIIIDDVKLNASLTE
jgi:hypothetical protein